MKRRLSRMAWVLALLAMFAIVVSEVAIYRAAAGRTFTDVNQLPHRKVALVLGCSPKFGRGPSRMFRYRIMAAAELLRAGKVEYLLVSGDRRRPKYNEPVEMRKALLAEGVPAERIVLDCAGLRTLDSIVRAKEIFGQQQVIVVSQHFHNQRAIFLANHEGLDAVGYNARDVLLMDQLRERGARIKALLDVYVLHTRPRFMGEPVAIP